MSVLKVIEVLAESEKNWEDAAQSAVAEAGKSVRNIKSIYQRYGGNRGERKDRQVPHQCQDLVLAGLIGAARSVSTPRR